MTVPIPRTPTTFKASKTRCVKFCFVCAFATLIVVGCDCDGFDTWDDVLYFFTSFFHTSDKSSVPTVHDTDLAGQKCS